MTPSDSTRSGAGRHVKIIGVLLLIATVVFVVTRLDSFKAKLSDMAAVTEGRGDAANLTSPDSLLSYVLRHPDQASLVVFDTDAPEAGLFVEADAERPLAGLPTVWLAAQYARGVADGQLDPEEAVPYADIEVFALPAIEGDRHRATLARMGLADTLIAQEGGGRPQEVVSVHSRMPLRRVVEAAVRHGDRPSTDYLVMRFDRFAVADLTRPYDLGPPVPTSGLYLAWTPTYRGATAQERLDGFLALTTPQQADTAFAVAERLQDDEAYRARERERLRFESLSMTVEQQRAAARASFPKGTAQAYADALADIATATFVSDTVAAKVHDVLGNPIELFASVVPDAEVRGKAGGFTGLYSIGAYARRPDGTARVAVLLMQDLPTAVFIEAGRQALDQGLVAILLGSDAFVAQAKDLAAN
ncbi:MAG: hypothetical protein AAF624_09945 [Bacteroidota bacterium]